MRHIGKKRFASSADRGQQPFFPYATCSAYPLSPTACHMSSEQHCLLKDCLCFESKALCSFLSTAKTQLQKILAGHLRPREKFKVCRGSRMGRTPRNELRVLCEEQGLTFPKFNSLSQLGICAQPGSTKTTRCTYKIGTCCQSLHPYSQCWCFTCHIRLENLFGNLRLHLQALEMFPCLHRCF